VCLEASTKPHVQKKFEIFWTNIESTMACQNFKNGPKKVLRCLGVKSLGLPTVFGNEKVSFGLEHIEDVDGFGSKWEVHLNVSSLTPKGPRVIFSKNAPNLPFLAQEAKMNFFSLFCTFNCRILP
jgi:hypothetical protein